MTAGTERTTISQRHSRPLAQSRRLIRVENPLRDASTSHPLAKHTAISATIQRRLRRGERAGSSDMIATVPLTSPMRPRLVSFHQNEGRCIAIGMSDRSEEHTSELQSQSNLVCRL